MCLLIGHSKQSFQIPKTNIHYPWVAQKIAAREFFFFMKGHQYGYHGVILTMFVNHVRSVRAQNNALRKIGCWVTMSRNHAGCSFKNKTKQEKTNSSNSSKCPQWIILTAVALYEWRSHGWGERTASFKQNNSSYKPLCPVFSRLQDGVNSRRDESCYLRLTKTKTLQLF